MADRKLGKLWFSLSSWKDGLRNIKRNIQIFYWFLRSLRRQLQLKFFYCILCRRLSQLNLGRLRRLLKSIRWFDALSRFQWRFLFFIKDNMIKDRSNKRVFILRIVFSSFDDLGFSIGLWWGRNLCIISANKLIHFFLFFFDLFLLLDFIIFLHNLITSLLYSFACLIDVINFLLYLVILLSQLEDSSVYCLSVILKLMHN